MGDIWLFTLGAGAIGLLAFIVVKVWLDTKDEDWPR